MPDTPIFHRTELLVGTQALDRLRRTRVILFGVGGVGSWCAEALIRSGVGDLTMVDSDVVCVTNVNRQVQATSRSVGNVKVSELRTRLLQINPDAAITAMHKRYDQHTRATFRFEQYDYVIDAIDSLTPKVDLLATASAEPCTLLSAMGAACKTDPTRIRAASIWETDICPLARAVRKRLRRRGVNKDTRDFLCIYSDEMLSEARGESPCGTGRCFCPKTASDDGETVVDEWCGKKALINGSVVHVTGAFGFALAGLVIQDVMSRSAHAGRNSSTAISG